MPVEFFAVRDPTHSLPGHHELLLANALAQAQALMQGKHDAGGHRNFSGNRPSTFFLLQALNPTSLGALIAYIRCERFGDDQTVLFWHTGGQVGLFS